MILLIQESDARDGDLSGPQTQRGCSHVTVSRMPGLDNAAVFNLDPAPQLVGEPKSVCFPERLEIVDVVGGRIVVVADAEIQRDS
jgi:hypothetical protein